MSQAEFRISDLYVMPDEDVRPWQDARDAILDEVFGMREHEIDMDAIREAGEERLLVHRKMQTMFDDEGEWSAGIYVLSLDGRPFGAFVGSGESESAATVFLVTDESLQKEATAYAEQFRNRPRNGVFVGDDFDLRTVKIHDGVIVGTPEGFRLVDQKFAGKDGTLLFDEEAFRKAFQGSVDDRLKANRDIGWILSEGAALVAAAIPEGIERVVVNEPPKDYEGRKLMWFAAAAATSEGTYAIGVHAHALERNGIDWGSNVVAARIGGPEEFAGLKERYAPETSAPTP